MLPSYRYRRACTPVISSPPGRIPCRVPGKAARAAVVLAGAAMVLAPVAASAQGRAAADFPTRPIRIIIGFTPGGQPDIFSRLIASRLTDVLGQNVLVDNRPARVAPSVRSWWPMRCPTGTRCSRSRART